MDTDKLWCHLCRTPDMANGKLSRNNTRVVAPSQLPRKMFDEEDEHQTAAYNTTCKTSLINSLRDVARTNSGLIRPAGAVCEECPINEQPLNPRCPSHCLTKEAWIRMIWAFEYCGRWRRSGGFSRPSGESWIGLTWPWAE